METWFLSRHLRRFILLLVANSAAETLPFMRTLLDAAVVKWVMTVNHRDDSVFATTLADREIWEGALSAGSKNENMYETVNNDEYHESNAVLKKCISKVFLESTFKITQL